MEELKSKQNENRDEERKLSFHKSGRSQPKCWAFVCVVVVYRFNIVLQ